MNICLCYDLLMGAEYYGGVIWTNHALRRMYERGVSRQIAYETFAHPDRTVAGREKETTQYQKRFDNSLVTVIAKQNATSEWVVLSAWMDPPLTGSEDDKRRIAYRNYQKASFWGKMWITVKRQLGLSKY